MTNKNALSVQSLACHGKCSLSEALPLVSACGIALSVIPTVILSTHTGGFGTPVKQDMTEFLSDTLQHFKKEKLTFDGVYTGYFSSALQIEKFFQEVENLTKPESLLFVDPVLGDKGRLFSGITHDFAKAYLKLCQKANIITPNLTEAYILSGEEYKEQPSLEEITELSLKLYNLTGAKVVLTGVELEGKIGSAVFDGEDFVLKLFKKHPQNFHGTGDMLASLIFGLLLNGRNLFKAVEFAQELVYEALKATETEEKNGTNFESLIKIKS